MTLSQCSHIRRLTLCIKNFTSFRQAPSNTDNNKMAAPNNSDSNRSTISRVRSPRDVQRVVEGLNLPFRHFSNKIPTQRKVRKLEKKHALLFTGKALRTFFSRHCECKERVGVSAVLRFKTIVLPLYFNKDLCAVASLIKIINDKNRMASPKHSNSKISAVARIESIQDVQRVVEGLNLSFRHISKIPAQRELKKLEKTHMLLFTGKALRRFFFRRDRGVAENEYDAMLKCNDTYAIPIWFGNGSRTVASFTKLINENIDGGFDNTCLICYEDACYGMNRICFECGFRWCIVCEFKLLFNTSGRLILFECPQCRKLKECRLCNIYVVLLDQMDKFTEQQKMVIKLLQQEDPESETRLKKWNDRKRLKPESTIRVFNLQRNLELNGKVGGITGKSKTKNGTTRWPVHLTGSERIIMIKEENLSVLCRPDM